MLFAAKRAIESARQDAGNTDYFPLGMLHSMYEDTLHLSSLQWDLLQSRLFRLLVWSTPASLFSKLLLCVYNFL